MQLVGLQPVISRPLRIVRYRDMKRHDISISLLGYDIITRVIWERSVDEQKLRVIVVVVVVLVVAF